MSSPASSPSPSPSPAGSIALATAADWRGAVQKILCPPSPLIAPDERPQREHFAPCSIVRWILWCSRRRSATSCVDSGVVRTAARPPPPLLPPSSTRRAASESGPLRTARPLRPPAPSSSLPLSSLSTSTSSSSPPPPPPPPPVAARPSIRTVASTRRPASRRRSASARMRSLPASALSRWHSRHVERSSVTSCGKSTGVYAGSASSMWPRWPGHVV